VAAAQGGSYVYVPWRPTAKTEQSGKKKERYK
jgi:hypothetical protein